MPDPGIAYSWPTRFRTAPPVQKKMQTSDFDYHLPQELIAQTPIEPRDSSRLLVLHRATGLVEHQRFNHLLEYLRAGDVMVFNQSRVMPARLHGWREDTGGRVELLLLKRESPGIWQVLAKPARRLRPGTVVVLDWAARPAFPPGGAPLYEEITPGPAPKITLLASQEDGIKRVQIAPEEGWHQWGETPLPPYIHQRLEDPERYQTVYARQSGSVAAPTAGLHFTQSTLEGLEQLGVIPAFVTLHVGLDTFRPVHGEDPTRHEIHTEYYEVGAETVSALNQASLNQARADGRRVIAVGTTSVRVLEQLALNLVEDKDSALKPAAGQAGLFILPGHRFRLVDAMITNFHLPRSTLLMLVSAFAGREPVLAAYQEAIERQYRFYSFGDAMLIL